MTGLELVSLNTKLIFHLTVGGIMVVHLIRLPGPWTSEQINVKMPLAKNG